MSTSCGWEGKGRYGSFQLWMNMWVWYGILEFNVPLDTEHVGVQVKLKSLENTCHT